MGAVGLLQDADLVIGEVDLERCDRVGQVMRLGGTHDGGVYHRVPQHPCQGDLRHGDTASFGDLGYCFDDGAIGLDVEPPADRIGVEALGVLAPRPGQSPLASGL
jgi:hypothetical protein